MLFAEAAIAAPATEGLPLTKGEILKRELEGTAERIARDRIGADIVVSGKIRLSYEYARSLSLKERVLEERGWYCQLCGFSFRKKSGIDEFGGLVKIVTPIVEESRAETPWRTGQGGSTVASVRHSQC